MIAFGVIPPIALTLVPFFFGPYRHHKKESKRTIGSAVDDSTIGYKKATALCNSSNISLKVYPILREV